MKKVVQDLTSGGIDWQREKWQSGLGSKFIHQGEKNAVKYADEVIVLSKGVQDYFKEIYGRETHFIPNGVNGFQTIIPTAAAVLSEKRQILRLTQQEVADRAKITLRQYQRLESGERNILTSSFGLACRVIEALDMDVSKFYHGDYYLEELKTIEGK